MVIVKLNGGLGNQMFQYAAAKSLADYLKTALKIDISYFNHQNSTDTQRQYELDAFALPQDFADLNEVLDIIKGPESKIIFYSIKILKKLGLIKGHYFREKDFTYQADFFRNPEDVVLEGYWQSEKYFLKDVTKIRESFIWKKPLEGKNRETAEMIANADSVSIHIRRGDYINNPATNQFHGTCDIPYYQKAISVIKERMTKPAFFIFSDEIEWAKNLDIKGPVHYIDWNKDRESHIDMHLMSLCRHHIIANSSFSWWGAWLGRNPDKTVVAPVQWFKNTSINTKDLVPDNWLRI